MCGYTDGPYVYPCEKGCCSEDCGSKRGSLTQGKLVEKKPDESRPVWVPFAIGALIVLILFVLLNMLKEKKPFQRRNGR
jgi:hypothetical protein